MGRHTGGKCFIHGLENRNKNQILSIEHSCWLYLVVSKSDIKGAHGQYLFKQVCGQKHPRETALCRNSILYINHFIIRKYYQHTGQTTSAWKGQASIGHPFCHRVNNKLHTSSVRHLHLNNILPHYSYKHLDETATNQEETHCPPHKFRRLFLDLYLMSRQMCRYHKSRSAAILHSLVKDTPRLHCTIICMQWVSYVYHWYCIQ